MFICDISVFNKYGKQKLDEMLCPLKVDWRELVVMLVLEQVPGMGQALLIPFLQTDKANVTKLLQMMEKKGLIRRETDAADQRNKTCHLADQGHLLIPKLHETLALWEAACFNGLTKEEIQQFQRTSEIITRNLVRD
ncbi:MarR family winged helix-turn-helix transcriptional regulator [Anaerobium acetethylicum]|uniref:DNA-binding transcriptional regulator, MarR family n=1 Tax=Anaerobium acetethylicum TaxID=1619234 RepID=A0A1D3TSP0_9FIRM|nr:MarR family transcriptional regulator [Anaerobium acetethylicum]SCP96928.1 DNA-binding transcriptional regulator, MarR family [Anaerobium acetethylicum]